MAAPKGIVLRRIVLALLIVGMLNLSGCLLTNCGEDYSEEDLDNMQQAQTDDFMGIDRTPWTRDPDHVLANGTVLSVRLLYGGALADESAWYRVRLDNERNRLVRLRGVDRGERSRRGRDE